MSLRLTGHKLMYHQQELNKWSNSLGFYPIHLDISPTGRCNHRCFHCYVNYLGHERGYLKEDIYLKLSKDIGRLGVKSIFIAGTGEPFLNKATANAIEIASQNGTDVAVATNGILLDEKIINKILPSLTWIRFSVLGGTSKTYAKYHGTKEKDWHSLNENMELAAAIKRKRKLKVTLGSVFCILPENGAEIVVFAEKLKKIGFDYLVIKPISQNPKNKLNVNLYLDRQYKKELDYVSALSDNNFKVIIRYDQFNCLLKREYKKCLGLPFIAVVSEDGGVYTCNGYWNDKEYCYGNLYEKDFKEIWDSKRRQDIQKRIEENINFDKCEPICRLNSINQFLWELKNPPIHVNFI